MLIKKTQNQCLKRGCFPKRWKIAKVNPVIKSAKENSLDPSKYHPISLLNMGGKILDKLLINMGGKILDKLLIKMGGKILDKLLINMGSKILDKLLTNRINYHLYKNELLTKKQFGFTPQRNTIDATMGAKSFIEPIVENRGLVIMTNLDVQ